MEAEVKVLPADALRVYSRDLVRQRRVDAVKRRAEARADLERAKRVAAGLPPEMTPEEQDAAMVELERQYDVQAFQQACRHPREVARVAAIADAVREREARAELQRQLERLEAERRRLGLDDGPAAQEDVTERARRYLERVPVDGHSSLLVVACHAARGFAMELVTAVEVVAAWAGSRWPRAEVTRTVKWAARHGRGELGYLLAGRARAR
jgi:hypothetical protein